jgi:hypothetical protein
MEENIPLEDFENSLVIFDDTEAIPNKKLKAKVYGIMNIILTMGRQKNVDCISVNHNACEGIQTKTMLNESHAIIFFPSSLSDKNIKYLTENYTGLKKHQVEKIMNSKSRHITVLKKHPRIVLGEGFAFSC